MLNFSPEKLLVIGILALVVLGPNRLPAAARSAGRVMAQLRRMSGSLQTEMRDALAEPRQALQHAVDEFGIKDLRMSVRDTLIPPAAPAAPAAAEAPPAVPAAAPSAPAPAAPSIAVPASAGTPVPDDPSFN